MNNTKTIKTSFSKWYSYFDIDEHTIKVSGSYFSGSEHIYLDEVLVSKKINCTFKSKHSFSLNGTNFDVLIEMLSIIKPQIRIQVLRNGEFLDEDYIFKNGESGKRQLRSYGVILGCAFTTGFVFYWLVKLLIGG